MTEISHHEEPQPESMPAGPYTPEQSIQDRAELALVQAGLAHVIEEQTNAAQAVSDRLRLERVETAMADQAAGQVTETAASSRAKQHADFMRAVQNGRPDLSDIAKH